MNVYTRYLEYVLYALYAYMCTQLASSAESGMTIILERFCISPTEAIHQGDKQYMQHVPPSDIEGAQSSQINNLPPGYV